MPAPYHAFVTPPVGNAPLVFAFHGTGGNETQFAPLVQDILPGAGLVAPRGDVSEGGANRFFRRTGEGVFDMADLAHRSAAMASFVAETRAAHPDREAYAVGYSNGANILAAMTFEHAHLFDRVALLHPLIPWKPAGNPGLKGQLVLITGGRKDPICPLALTIALADYYKMEGAKVTAILHEGGHEIRQDEVVALTGFLR
ncbi:alpha/beta hydrolase [Tabrizicola piscis]|uniref:Alpha/beta hydrolase n=1 Tax=Tabrizicola piscis TaxID=2494374 RepID=A0A3S8U7K7_9RHOB|nr:alpha/beta hydrolase [Tabrizicola piscis]AZL59563.1 alpha/beta hydrolase [Tabrizicola piscis]